MNKQNNQSYNSLLANNIVSCDPLIAEILKDCYTTILQRDEDQKGQKLNFFEIGLKESIEQNCKNGLDVRERQSKAILKSFNNLLIRRAENTWIKEEKELYDKIQDLISVKILSGDDGIIRTLEKYTESILRLNYSEELPAFVVKGDKKNVFNLFGYFLDSISEKISESTFSKKTIDALFDVQQEVVFIVTDEQFKIRSMNNVGENLFNSSIVDLKDKLLFELIPELGATNFNYYEANQFYKIPIQLYFENMGVKQVELSYRKVEEFEPKGNIKEINELIFVLDFNGDNQKFETSLHNDYGLIDNLINGLHDLKKDSPNAKSIENGSILLQYLYRLRENTKSHILNRKKTQIELNEIIDVDSIMEQVSHDLKYFPNKDRVSFTVENKKINSLIFNAEILFSMVKNLVSNSIRFQDLTKPTPTINVIFTDLANGTQIEVVDNGIGIEKKNIDKIFDRGYKVNSSFSDGLGLGLNIVSKSVSSVDGKLSVESEINEGTTIKIILPF